MASYKVVLNAAAEEGLKNGKYEFAPGGIRDKKTKKMVQLFRPTGETVGDSSEPSVQMEIGVATEKSRMMMAKADRVLAAVQKNSELSWEAAAVGYLNYNTSIQGFAEMTNRLESLQNTIDFNRLLDKKESFAKYYMILRDLLWHLAEEEPEIPIYEVSNLLSEIAAFINGIYEEYRLGKIEAEIAIKILIALIPPFVRCAEECCLLCQFKGKSNPPSYDTWMLIINRIMTSELLKQDLRKIAYLNMPTLSTYNLEYAARLPLKTVEHIRSEAERLRLFVKSSGISRKEYLSLPKEMEKRFLDGDYIIGEIVDERNAF